MDLRRIVGEDKLAPEEAKNKAEIVKKAYLEDIKYYRPDKKLDLEGNEKMEGKIDGSLSIISIQAGQFNQTIPWTKEGINYAKGFLDLLATQIITKEEKPKKES